MQPLLFEVDKVEELWFNKEGCKYFIIDTERKLSRLTDILRGVKYIAYDIETNGLSPSQSDIVGISICPEEGLSFYIPLGHKFSTNIPSDMFVSYLKPILETKEIIGHNIKFDYKFTKAKYDIDMNCAQDTYVLAKLMGIFNKVGLKYLGAVIFGFTVAELSNICDKYSIKYSDINCLLTEELYEYCCQDTDLTLRLFNYLKTDEVLESFVYKLELQLIPILAKIELRGVYTDLEALKDLLKQYNKEIESAEETLIDLLEAPSNININSNEQLSKYILKKYPSLAKKFKYSSKDGVIQLDAKSVVYYISILDKEIETGFCTDSVNLFKLYAHRKELFSIKTKYLTSWIQNIEKNKSFIVYTSFNSLGADTGRMSSNNPNLQNIPPLIRSAVKPRDGYYFLSMDYDQMEYRILAGMAGLKHLAEEINKEKADVHSLTASLLFSIPLEEVTKDLRSIAKTINFGVLYGMGDYKLAETLKISIEEAKKLRTKYKKRFLGNTPWFKRVISFAKENGYVLTAYGRKRIIDNINVAISPDDNDIIRKEKFRLLSSAERKAINTPIQGTSADITKIGTVNVVNKIVSMGLDVHPILIIHDEIVFEVADKYEPDYIINVLKECLEVKQFKELVDLTVDSNISKLSWGDLK